MSKEEWIVGIVLSILFIGGYFILMWLAPEWVGISSRAEQLEKKAEAEKTAANDKGQS
ncbi:MAG: hypothetical protein K2X47_14995 [Bdellovibrionales bacterium]|nr:hypothetical protein [Bdellovibrionales bacterium]